MSDGEQEGDYAILGVNPGVTPEELERVFLQKNFALIRGRAGSADESNPQLDAQRAALRAAFERLSAKAREEILAPPRRRPQLPPLHPPRPSSLPPLPVPASPRTDERRSRWEWAGAECWRVNVVLPPLMLGLVALVQLTPLKFFLNGFHVWMHEFGHATAAWLCGRKATPLPLGWTPVEPDFSWGVYGGVLFLLVLLGWVGWRERKPWAVLLAAGLAGLQFYCSWRLTPSRQEFWWGAFGGVGGEFYLSTLFMLGFWVELPEKFKWGWCRYVFFLIGATAFLNIWLHWRDVYRGIEEIPFGTMINGEDDQAGDMNKLMDAYGWRKFDIRRNYLLLGWGCWAVLGMMWLVCVLRLHRIADWVTGLWSRKETTTGSAGG